MDFGYRIFNNGSGDEVEHCGNGARCFARYVRDRGMIGRDTHPARPAPSTTTLELHIQADGRVQRRHERAACSTTTDLPFDARRPAAPTRVGDFETWPLDLGDGRCVERGDGVDGQSARGAVRVDRRRQRSAVAAGSDRCWSGHARFAAPRQRRLPGSGRPRSHVRLRVYERDAGETLACGTGACAAVVAGIRLGLAGPEASTSMHAAVAGSPSNGPAARTTASSSPVRPTTVFEGEIEL